MLRFRAIATSSFTATAPTRRAPRAWRCGCGREESCACGPCWEASRPGTSVASQWSPSKRAWGPHWPTPPRPCIEAAMAPSNGPPAVRAAAQERRIKAAPSEAERHSQRSELLVAPPRRAGAAPQIVQEGRAEVELVRGDRHGFETVRLRAERQGLAVQHTLRRVNERVRLQDGS